MTSIDDLLSNNRRWAAEVERREPGFFASTARQQMPKYLWIGCSDSRVPPNEIVGLRPGELFVHRNVANLVAHTDLNCQSVIQFAVEVLGVSHIIVCGHYGCGGVSAAMTGTPNGPVGHWLRPVKDVRDRHRRELDAIADADARTRRLCELNVAEQVRNVRDTETVQNAWRRNHPLTIHGWAYDIHNGLLRVLQPPATTPGP